MPTMNSGMLWTYQPGRDLQAAIVEAATYFASKYAVRPNSAFVNPGALGEETLIAGVTVRPSKSVMLNHIWIGSTETDVKH